MSQQEVLASLQARIGQEIHQSDWLEVTQQRINAFADATGDHQWIHVDPARAARESPWKATIAHGYLTLSLYPLLRGLVDERRPLFPGIKQVINPSPGQSLVHACQLTPDEIKEIHKKMLTPNRIPTLSVLSYLF